MLGTPMNPSPRDPVQPAGEHALVFGGSMAGLTTAGVLARHFKRVTLIERDLYEEGTQHRKGVPQAHHLHGLLTRGLHTLSAVFPGFEEDLKAAGAEFLDTSADVANYLAGTWWRPMHIGLNFHAQSRPLLDFVVRKRIRALPNVTILQGREVTGFTSSADKARITGVTLRVSGGGTEEVLASDWVVDASGRGSRTPQWLEKLGYPRVEETRIHVDVAYATRIYQRPPGLVTNWRMLAFGPQLPRAKRMAVIEPIEEDRWLVSLVGWLGDHAPTDDEGFLSYARALPIPHIYEALQHAKPLSPVVVHRFPFNQRRYYDRMTRFPERLALLGDSHCSFNPTYGQGITSAGLQAEALDESLRAGLPGATDRYRRNAAQAIQICWAMATGSDLRFPEVEGKRPLGSGLMNWYGDRFQKLAAHDEEAQKTFMRVMHLLDSPAALLSPRLVLKVLFTAGKVGNAQNHAPAPLAIPSN